jgi:hypothetical protein
MKTVNKTGAARGRVSPIFEKSAHGGMILLHHFPLSDLRRFDAQLAPGGPAVHKDF